MTDSLKLTSGIEKPFYRAFKLDPDSLQRIVGTLEKYQSDLGVSSSIVFYVNRYDERFYETTNIQNVLDDPNVDKNEIRYLSIDIRDSRPDSKPEPYERDYIARINFHKSRKVKVGIWISAQDRKWALLLADELELQIKRTFKCTQVPNWLLLCFYTSIGILATIWLPRIAGLNYVLDVFVNTSALFIWPGLILLAYFTYVGSRPKWLAKLVGPEPVFLWGDQSSEYLKRNKMRTNILWGIIVTFIVSIIANLFTSLLLSFDRFIGK